MIKFFRVTESPKLFSVSRVILCPQPCCADMWHLPNPPLPFAVLCLANCPGSLSVWMGNDPKGWQRGIYLSEKELVPFGIERHSSGSWLG